jgi:hypothetical protein
MLAVCIFSAVMLCGCGGSTSDGAATTTEEGRRFSALQQLGAGHSKQDLAAHRKQALAEIAQKKKETQGK